MTENTPNAVARNRAGEIVATYWPVAAAVVAIAAGWGTLVAQNSYTSTNVTSAVIEIKQLRADFAALSTSVATVKTAGDYRDRDIAELRGRITRIETRR
jgi:hypothetical protein